MALDRNLIAQIQYENALDRTNAALLNLQAVQLQVIQSSFRLEETLRDTADASSRLYSATASLTDLQSRGGDVLEEVARLQQFFNERFQDYLNIVSEGRMGTADYINVLRDLNDISSAVGSVQDENRFFFDALAEAQRKQEDAARDLQRSQRELLQIGFQRVQISIAEARANFQVQSSTNNLSIAQTRLAGTSRNLREQMALIVVQSIASVAGIMRIVSGFSQASTQSTMTANEFTRLAIVASSMNTNFQGASFGAGRLESALGRLKIALTSTQFAVMGIVAVGTILIGTLLQIQAEGEEAARATKAFADIHPRASAEIDAFGQSILNTKVELAGLHKESELQGQTVRNLDALYAGAGDAAIGMAINEGKLETQISGLVNVFEDENISVAEARQKLEALKVPAVVIDEIARRLALSYQGLADAQKLSAQRTQQEVEAMDRLSKSMLTGVEPALEDVKLAYRLTDDEAKRFLATLKGPGGMKDTLDSLEEAPALGHGLAADFFVQPPIVNVNVDINVESVTVEELSKLIAGALVQSLKSEIVAEVRATTG